MLNRFLNILYSLTVQGSFQIAFAMRNNCFAVPTITIMTFEIAKKLIPELLAVSWNSFDFESPTTAPTKTEKHAGTSSEKSKK